MVKIYTKIITEKILILLLFETQKNNKAEGGIDKTKKQKNPQKSASERAAAILVYENLLFSRDCAMFFNIGYFISK